MTQKNYSIFQEEPYLRATYKLVSTEEQAFLIIVVNEDDLQHGFRVITFDKKKKEKLTNEEIIIDIRDKPYFFNPATKKLRNMISE